jgi:hypothetical protein
MVRANLLGEETDDDLYFFDNILALVVVVIDYLTALNVVRYVK